METIIHKFSRVMNLFRPDAASVQLLYRIRVR